MSVGMCKSVSFDTGDFKSIATTTKIKRRRMTTTDDNDDNRSTASHAQRHGLVDLDAGQGNTSLRRFPHEVADAQDRGRGNRRLPDVPCLEGTEGSEVQALDSKGCFELSPTPVGSSRELLTSVVHGELCRFQFSTALILEFHP